MWRRVPFVISKGLRRGARGNPSLPGAYHLSPIGLAELRDEFSRGNKAIQPQPGRVNLVSDSSVNAVKIKKPALQDALPVLEPFESTWEPNQFSGTSLGLHPVSTRFVGIESALTNHTL